MPGEPSSIKTQVFVPGKGESYSGPRKLLTLEKICEWIRMQGFDEYTTNGLIEEAGKYPTQALPSFRRNFNLMIARVREKRRSEQQQEENEQAANNQVAENKLDGDPNVIPIPSMPELPDLDFEIPDKIEVDMPPLKMDTGRTKIDLSDLEENKDGDS